MFTGIVTHIGEVVSFEGGRLVLRVTFDTSDVAMGASVACSGVCLTVVEKTSDTLSFDVSGETLSKTVLGNWQAGTSVNLERPLKVGDELGGHYVSGHVDGVGKMISREQDGKSFRMVFSVPDELKKFLTPKGSITVDGVSLTVNDVDDNTFGVCVIPHTQEVTTLGEKRMDDLVNIEVDMLARYVLRQAG